MVGGDGTRTLGNLGTTAARKLCSGCVTHDIGFAGGGGSAGSGMNS
jgi:hypothetical protein